jgi:hypothetical protein
MTDKRSFEERVASGEGAVSLINEPVVDYAVEYPVSPEYLRAWLARLPPIEKAWRRWRFVHVHSGDRHDRSTED